MVRPLALGLVAAACACIAVGALVSTACITAPPPQLPAEVEHRPTIRHESLVPSASLTLTELPTGGFVVPILLEDPNESFQWDVFVDYNPCIDPPTCQAATSPEGPIQTVTPTPGTLDGGVVPIGFALSSDVDPTQCHRIDFLVAHAFERTEAGDVLGRTFDSVGGDIATWTYDPGGAVPCLFIVYDAGALQDGAFPPVDAAPDSLPIVPDSGTD